MRVALVNEQRATESAVAAVSESVIVGMPVRLLVVDGEKSKPIWVAAGVKGP